VSNVKCNVVKGFVDFAKWSSAETVVRIGRRGWIYTPWLPKKEELRRHLSNATLLKGAADRLELDRIGYEEDVRKELKHHNHPSPSLLRSRRWEVS
jgi:hypothetical protein